MKIFKRTLSVILAFLMIFSSVSLLASAVIDDGNGNSAEFRIEYYRNAGTKEAPDWKKTDAIKRGDQLQVRFFTKTDYMVGTSSIFFVYAKNFMKYSTEGFEKAGTDGFDISNIANKSTTSIPQKNSWTGYLTTATTPGGFKPGDVAKALVNDGYLTQKDFEDKGWIAVSVTNGSPAKLTDEEHLLEFVFEVIATPAEGTVLADEGFMYVIEDAVQNTTTHDYAFTFIGEAKKSTAFGSYEGWEQDYSYTFNDKDTISTKSKVILNAGEEGHYGLGTNKVPDTEAENDKDKDDIKTTAIAEEMGTAVAVPTAIPTPYSATKVFKGWALADDETQTVLTADDFAALSYGYNNINLNAVYEAAGATYNLVVVKQKADGKWPTDEEIAAIEPESKASSDGAVIKASEYDAEAGFTVANTDEITVSATEVKTLTVRLARNTVKVTFDGADEVSGLYGAEATAPAKTVEPGYTNSGWYSVDAEGAKTLVAADGGKFTIPAVDANYVSDVTPDKQDVTVNVVYYDEIAKENKTVAVTYEDATVTGGKVKIAEAEGTEEGVSYILLSDIAAKALAKEAELKHYAYDAGSASNDLDGEATADGLTLTVAYDAVEYKTTFDTTVDGIPDVVINVPYGNSVVADKLPTEEAMEAVNPGYEFEGWFDGDKEFVPGTTVVTGEATYKAKFTANKVKIDYEYAGDDIPTGDSLALPADREDAVYNEEFTLPNITAPDGYTLKWNVTGATKVNETTYKVGTTDVTVTGTWSLNPYTITYYLWDTMTEADVHDEKVVTYKDAIPSDVTVVIPGYQFVEWEYYNAETNKAEEYKTMPAHDVYAIASTTQITYTVQFLRYKNYVGGETEEEKATIALGSESDMYQGMILQNQVPATAATGYDFKGWVDANGETVKFVYTFEFKDAEGNYVVIPDDGSWEYDPLTAIATMKVYAVYTAQTINVEFDPDGGYFTVKDEETGEDVIKEDSMIVETKFNEYIEKDPDNWNIAKDGFTFDGWDPFFENEDQITPEESDYFMALWLPNITYVFAGNAPKGIDPPAEKEGVQPGSVIDVPKLEVAGYSYTISYSEDAFEEEDGTWTIDGMPVTVTYTWKAEGDIPYTVQTYLENADVTATEFNADNYTFKEEVERTGTAGEPIAFAEELYKGFKFEKLEPADATIGGDGQTVVKAYYSRNTINVTVTDEDGNEITDENGNPIVPPTAETGDEIKEPTYKPETDEPGKEFDKWVEEDGKTPVTWPLPVEGDEDIVIIPTFKYTDYSIKYVTDTTGEAAPEGYELPNTEFADTEVAHYGNDVAVPAWDNNTVPGYNVTITVTGDGAVEKDGAYTVGEGNVVVTAKWSKDIFTVTYETIGTAPNGYALPNEEFKNVENATIGNKVAVPAWTAPDGYSLDIKVNGAQRQNDGSYEVYNDNVTVTATWTQLTGIGYKVETYLENLNVTDVDNLDNYTFEETLTREGKTGDPISFQEDLYEGFKFYKQVPADATIGGDGNTTVKVYYTRDTVKITVKDEKGNEITDENGDPIFDEEYEYGDEIPEPGKDKQPAPTEPGTEFDKWVEEDGKTPVTWPLPVDGEEDIVIIPTYKYIDYSIEYVTEGEAPADYVLPNDTYKNTETAHYGNDVAVPAWNNETVSGYNVTITVTGDGAVEKDGAYTVGEGNVVVTAKWSYDEYALSYSYDATKPEGAVVPANESIHIGKVVTLATPDAVAGYTFAGWVINGTTYAAGASYTAGAADASAVGSWTANSDVEYFVRRHFEVLKGDTFGAEEKLIRMTGTAGQPATYTVEVEGFTLDHITPANATIGGDGKTVIDVYYTRDTVNVTVKNEDDTVNTDLTGEYEFGDSITEPSKPVSKDEGKEFDKWVYEDGTEVTWPLKIESEDPIVIKPSFINKIYTVRFLISKDKVYTEDENAEYTAKITKPADPDPTKYGMTGYSFIEWRRGSADGAPWTENDTVPAGDVDYYAYFKGNSNIPYKITQYFQNVTLDGWDYSLTQTETIPDGTAGEEVTLDVNAFKVDGFSINEADSITKLTINGAGTTEFVIYHLRNTTTIIVDGVEEEVIYGDTITEDEAEKIIKENGTYDEGYEYKGWTDETGNPVTFPYTIPVSGGKLTPVYDLKSFTLTFVDDDGNEVQSGKVPYKTVLKDVAPEYPNKSGYTPTGWFDVADDTAMPATMPAKDVTYKVGYTNAKNTAYTITVYMMDLDGSYNNKTSTTAYGTTGDSVRIVPEEQIGFYEDTTHENRNLSGIIAADGSTELRIYYARKVFTVTYDNGTPIEAFYGSAIPAPTDEPIAPAKGQEFTGWIDADDKKPSDYSSMPEKNLEFTSTWAPVKYTITYVVNGTITTEKYMYGETINAPANPSVPGMNFTGWVYEGGTGIPATMPDKDLVIVAQFGTAFYTVTFLDDENGAEFDKITVLYGATITLPAEEPTKEYHVFVEWLNVPETMPAENIVIVPKFERVPVKLVPKTDSTTVIDYDEKIIYGLKTGLTDSVLREQFLAVEGDGYIVINTYDGLYGFYGTGATVDLYDNVTGELLDTYTIVVFGDINGDSRINSTDVSAINDEVNRADINSLWSYEALATYDKYKTMAANINMDARVDANDKSTITNATLGSVRIDQVTREVIRADA